MAEGWTFDEPAGQVANPHRVPGDGQAVRPMPFVRNGWLFLPDTAKHYPAMVRLDTVVAVEVAKDDTVVPRLVYAEITIANGTCYHTDLELFDEVVRLVEAGVAP